MPHLCRCAKGAVVVIGRTDVCLARIRGREVESVGSRVRTQHTHTLLQRVAARRRIAGQTPCRVTLFYGYGTTRVNCKALLDIFTVFATKEHTLYARHVPLLDHHNHTTCHQTHSQLVVILPFTPSYHALRCPTTVVSALHPAAAPRFPAHLSSARRPCTEPRPVHSHALRAPRRGYGRPHGW